MWPYLQHMVMTRTNLLTLSHEAEERGRQGDQEVLDLALMKVHDEETARIADEAAEVAGDIRRHYAELRNIEGMDFFSGGVHLEFEGRWGSVNPGQSAQGAQGAQGGSCVSGVSGGLTHEEVRKHWGDGYPMQGDQGAPDFSNISPMGPEAFSDFPFMDALREITIDRRQFREEAETSHKSTLTDKDKV